MKVIYPKILLLMCFVFLSSHALTKGAAFINPITNTTHKFVAANYTDLGINNNRHMPSDEGSIKANAAEDLDRLRNLGITNVRVWAYKGYNIHEYGKMANRVKWLGEVAVARNMTLTVDLFDSAGNHSLADLHANDVHITNMINHVIGPNANKNYLLWSLGNEIGGYENPLGFADYYESKVNLMRSKGATHISFQPVAGSLEHRWSGDTRQAAIRVINASDDISVHYYAKGRLQNEHAANQIDFPSLQQWINLAHQLCKPAIIGEFSIESISLRTDTNVTEWLNWFENTLKVDQVSFWQFTKNELGHTDDYCFCAPGFGGNGPHINAMNGFLNSAPNFPNDSSCGNTTPPPSDISFQTGSNNPVYLLADHNQYLSSENGNNYVNANRSALGAWERFYIYPNSDGSFSIKASNNRYLDVDQTSGHYLKFNSTDRYCSDCKFNIVSVGGDRYGIKPKATHLYLSSENGQHPVRANRTALQSWEKWTIKNISASSTEWKTITSSGELAVGHSYYSHNNQYRLTMQSDGNLVLYRSDNTPVWHTHTYGNSGARCYLQNDGNLVIYKNGNAIWHTHTYGHSGASLQISNSGKIRIVLNGQTLWQS